MHLCFYVTSTQKNKEELLKAVSLQRYNFEWWTLAQYHFAVKINKGGFWAVENQLMMTQ